MQPTQRQESRILSLDAVRGIAALTVLFAHLRLSFYPALISDSPSYSLMRIPLSIVLNGGAAVALFFVLSGFVLTYRFFNSDSLAALPDAIIRRWPRLGGPIVIVSLISGFLMGFGLYSNLQVAALNGSSWLKDLFTWTPQGAVEVIHALKEGIWGTFLTQNCPYNMNFWTMHYELIGSIAAYIFTFFVIIAARKLDWRIVLGGMILVWGREVIRFPYISSFFLGTILAFLHHRFRTFVWKEPVTLVLTAVLCVLIGGFSVPENDFSTAFYRTLGADTVIGRLSVRYGLHSVMAMILLSYALWVPSIRAFLSRPIMRKLGHLSFPIYLIHLPVICSLGAWTYLSMKSHGEFTASIAATLVSIVTTILASFPLAWIDDHWLVICRIIAPFRFITEKLLHPRRS